MNVWIEVEDALEAIIQEYEKVNHLISLYQDNKARCIGLKMIGESHGVALELGSGPGNFTRMITPIHKGPVICFDYSGEMINYARKRNKNKNISHVRGVFEALPFRRESIDLVAAAYALRDSLDKPRMYHEIGVALRKGGRSLLIDIGKPDIPLFRGFMAVYMKYLVPVIGGLATGRGYRNPWSILYDTYSLLPPNSRLRSLMSQHLGEVEMKERLLGAQVVAVAEKN
jgi:demethylmenaquinone methyltransferase/2-methoxy-6-polyprenyl-1,4-benzoquinol methylase